MSSLEWSRSLPQNPHAPIGDELKVLEVDGLILSELDAEQVDVADANDGFM
jgi:hypothetical protein